MSHQTLFDPKKFLPRVGLFLYDRSGNVLLHTEGEHNHWGLWEIPVLEIENSHQEIQKTLENTLPKNTFTIQSSIHKWTHVMLPESILNDFSNHPHLMGITYQWMAIEVFQPLMSFAPKDRDYNFREVPLEYVAGLTAPYKRIAYHKACCAFKHIIRNRTDIIEKLKDSIDLIEIRQAC